MTIINTNPGWVNADGLRVKFPNEHKVKGTAGEFNMLSSTHVTEFELDYADIVLAVDSTNVFILDYDTVFPDGATIEKIEVRTEVVWDSAGDAFTLDLGLVKRSDFTTIIDQDGLLVALPQSVMDSLGAVHTTVIGDSTPGTTTYAGTLLDEALAFDSVVCANWDGAAPSVGKSTIRIYWRPAFIAQ